MVGRSIVAEAGVDADQAAAAFWHFGVNWVRQPSAEQRKRMARKYRAVLLAGLCSVGSTNYDAGNFWDHVWKAIEARGDQNRQTELSDAFRYGLDSLGLSRFHLRSRRNVGEILLHGGVPLHSVGALATVLARWDAANPSGDARSFVSWLTGSGQQVATARGIDVPTWLFLSETGEIAEDFVERCLTALDQLGTASSDGVALPETVLDEISRAVGGSRASTRAGRKNRGRRLADSAPTIVFSSQRGVQVRLPPLEAYTESDIEWAVTTDGVGERVESHAPWPGDLIEPKFVTVRTPVRRAVVMVMPSDQTWELDLIDSDDPLLVFDGDTRQLVPSRSALPRGRVWVAVPNESGAPLSELLTTDGALTVIEKASVPPGWGGWHFASIDLSEASRLSIAGSEKWRYVSTIRRPRLIEGDRLAHIETRDGRAVLATPPRLELPGTGGEGMLEWQVSVATADGREISTSSHLVAAESVAVNPWANASDPVLGDFVVTVRGPLGRGATLRAAIAEGFAAESSTPFRWMRADGRGLDAADLRIRSSEAGRADLVLPLESGRWRRSTGLRTPWGALDITARLPSMSASATGTMFRSRSGGPIVLDLEALEGTTLRIEVSPETRGAQLAAMAGDRLVLALDATASGTTRSFALGQLSDALRIHRYAQLRLVADERSVPVAYVRPRQLASGVAVSEDGILTLEEALPVEGLMALAYPRFAPWVAPARIDFPADAVSVELPHAVRGEGAATFVLAVANPWVPLEVPALPDWSTRNAFIAEWSDPVEPDDPAERGFRTWLAGKGQCPASDAGLAVALKIYTLVPRFAKRIDMDRLRTDLAEAVRSSRQHVVEAVLHSRAETNELFRLFVEADVVTVPREDWASSELLWSFSPALGVVADSDEHVGPGREQFRENLVKYIGDSALGILDDGVDPFAATGKFGPAVRALDPMPQDRIDAIRDALKLLPGGMLDEDTRTSASLSLFGHRRDPVLDAVVAVSRSLIRDAGIALTVDLGPHATAPIEARSSDDGWMSLPTLSLACAFIARAAARGGTESAHTFRRLRKTYMRIAEIAPDIVQQDLGLAELWITRWNEQ